MALHKSLDLSELPFSPLSNEEHGSSFTRILQRYHEKMTLRYLARSMRSTNAGCHLSSVEEAMACQVPQFSEGFESRDSLRREQETML